MLILAPFNNIQLIDQRYQCYIPFNVLTKNASASLLDPALPDLCVSIGDISWKDTKCVINKVHKNVCVHSHCEDIKMLLQRNNICTTDCAQYLSTVLQTFEHCHAAQPPVRSRKVYLSSTTRGSNEIVCVDHKLLGTVDIFHYMDSVNRYPVCSIVSTTSMDEAILAFENGYISQFWSPSAMQGDKAFDNTRFTDYIKHLDLFLANFSPQT